MREAGRFIEGPERPRVLPWTVAMLLLPAAVLVSPVVHRGVEALGFAHGFPQTLRRLLMLAAVGALLLAARPWRDVPQDRWGLRGPFARPSLLVSGIALSTLLLAAILLVEAATGRLSWEGPPGVRKLWGRLPENVFGFAFLALFEEILFRGWMFDRLRRRLPVAAAVAAGSAVFGVLHAFRGSAARADIPATLAGAGEALAAWAANLVDTQDFLPRFVGLFLLATLLSAAFLRARSLYLSIGVHYGAIVLINLCSALTDRTPKRDWMGSKWLYDGVPGWVAMALATAVLWPRRPPAPTP